MGLAISRTKDGHPAVRVRHLTFAFLPGRISPFAVYSCFPAKPPEECVANDFTSHDKPVSNETEFTAYVQDIADHYDEISTLGRAEIAGTRGTPWGPSQTRKRYYDGIESVSTAGHGGFLLSPEMNEVVDESWRARDGAYEEDSAWAIVAFTFPNLFTKREQRFAEETLKNWYPDTWMKLTGKTLTVATSHVLAERAFKVANADKMVVISAISSHQHAGMVECIATKGGDRGLGIKKKGFLVPSDEYTASHHGFVIDESRHATMPVDEFGQ